MSKIQTTKLEKASPRATYQDVLDAPPHMVAEIVDGRIYTHSRPAPPYAIAGWRRERMPLMPKEAYFTLAPDWVCEVLSPSTRKLDLGGKWAVYARAGVGYHWFVDPDARSLETYQLQDTEWVLIDRLYEDASVSLPPFEAIHFNLSDLWPPHAVHKDTPKIATEPEPMISMK